MLEPSVEKEMVFKRIDSSVTYEPGLDYENYIQQRKLLIGQKILVKYRDKNLAFTKRQLEMLKLIAMGFSNLKIAKILNAKETTIKLLIYRLMKYIENVLDEKLDRFYLIVIAQELFNNNIPNTSNSKSLIKKR